MRIAECGIRNAKTDGTHSIHTNPTNVMHRTSCQAQGMKNKKPIRVFIKAPDGFS